jgi:hypothetical protein
VIAAGCDVRTLALIVAAIFCLIAGDAAAKPKRGAATGGPASRHELCCRELGQYWNASLKRCNFGGNQKTQYSVHIDILYDACIFRKQ